MKPDRVTAEAAVKTAWQEVLNRDDFGAEENFFDLGGSSLSLMRLQIRLAELLGTEIPLVELYGSGSIAGTVELIMALSEGESDGQD